MPNVDVRRAGEVVIAVFDTRIVMGIGSELLRDVVAELLAEGWKKIVLDLRRAPRIDSSGVGELAAASRHARAQGATIKLVEPQTQVRETLHISQLLPVFEIFATEEEAVASFG